MFNELMSTIFIFDSPSRATAILDSCGFRSIAEGCEPTNDSPEFPLNFQN